MFCYTSDRSYYESVAAEYGYTYDEYLAACGATDADVKQMVEDVIREELVFYAIVKAEGLSISDEEYEEGLAMYAAAQSEEISPEDFEAMYGKDAIVDALLWDEMIYALFDTTIFVTE